MQRSQKDRLPGEGLVKLHHRHEPGATTNATAPTTALAFGSGGDVDFWILPREGQNSVESLRTGLARKSRRSLNVPGIEGKVVGCQSAT